MKSQNSKDVIFHEAPEIGNGSDVRVENIFVALYPRGFLLDRRDRGPDIVALLVFGHADMDDPPAGEAMRD